MSDTDGSVVAAEEGGEGAVDECFGFSVKGGGGFVKDEDVRVFDEGAGDGYSLFLAPGELGTAGADRGVEAIRLGGVSVWGKRISGSRKDDLQSR